MRFLIPILVFTLLDIYLWFNFRSMFSGNLLMVTRIAHVASVIIFIAAIVSLSVKFNQGYGRSDGLSNFFLGMILVILATKLTLAIVFGVQDAWRGMKFVADWGIFKRSESVSMESRRRFIGQMGLIIAAVPFSSLLYGMIAGKYSYKVRRESLAFPDLPEAFDGFKILQISDIHSGSFDDPEAVRRGVEMMKAENADIVVFTGDLVNNYADEFDDYVEMFGEVKAPYGKFAILGNHDYGEYVRWENAEAKKNNTLKIIRHNENAGFKVLLNDSSVIEKDGQKIRILGVENWGRPPFPSKGSLEQALTESSNGEFRILLSHDPHHFEDIVSKHPELIHLTLSGHTHGAQMGIEIPGIKISPARLRSRFWAGHYTENERHLYVNRGFGFIGYPGRVGMDPEITVIELKKA